MSEFEYLSEGQAASEIRDLVKESRAKAFVKPEVVAEMADMLGSAIRGSKRAAFNLSEAISTSDLALNALLAVVDRETIAAYNELQPVWSQYVSRTTVNDFRAKELWDFYGPNQTLQAVPELTEYPTGSMGGHSDYSIKVAKFGLRYALSFESMINDQVGELADLPNCLARAARESENRMGTGLLTSGNGPRSEFGTADDADLSYDSLKAALETMAQKPYPNGVPVGSQKLVLIVPPALEPTANEILSIREVRVTDGDNTFIQGNALSGAVRVIVDPWLKVLDQNAKVDATWYLVPEPSSPRKSLYMAFLRGHETPELRVKADTGNRIGGGAIDTSEGSFDIDDIQFRVRHFLGSAVTLTRDLYASQGSGS